MKTVAIMQPTYLPWCGYLDMIDQADVFVLLDTVAIARQSWQTRNRVLDRGGHVVWLSVPINSHMGQPLGEVEITQDGVWHRKHSRTLSGLGSYAIWDLLECYEQLPTRLVEFTGRTLQILCRTLGITTPLVWASSLGLSDWNDLPNAVRPGARLYEILAKTEATEFLNTAGGQATLPVVDMLGDVPIRWHEYDPVPYPQNGDRFLPYMSVVDCLARHGPEKTFGVIHAGRRVLAL